MYGLFFLILMGLISPSHPANTTKDGQVVTASNDDPEDPNDPGDPEDPDDPGTDGPGGEAGDNPPKP